MNRSNPYLERAAEAVYNVMPFGPVGGKPAWVPGGNSLKQSEARMYARAVLAAVERHFRGVTTPPDDIAREMLQQRNQARATAAGLQKQNRKLTAIIEERDIRIASLTAEVAKHENGDAHRLIATLRGKYDDAMATMEELAKRAQPFSFEEAEKMALIAERDDLGCKLGEAQLEIGRLQSSEQSKRIKRLENEVGTFQLVLEENNRECNNLAIKIAQLYVKLSHAGCPDSGGPVIGVDLASGPDKSVTADQRRLGQLAIEVVQLHVAQQVLVDYVKAKGVFPGESPLQTVMRWLGEREELKGKLATAEKERDEISKKRDEAVTGHKTAEEDAASLRKEIDAAKARGYTPYRCIEIEALLAAAQNERDNYKAKWEYVLKDYNLLMAELKKARALRALAKSLLLE